MPKIKFTCRMCEAPFELFPALVRHAEKRSSQIQFCSKSCQGKARSQGLIGAKRRTGQHLNCEVCGTRFYAKKSKAEKVRFCAEPCRMEAYRQNMVDRTAPRPNRMLGKMIKCQFCEKEIYRKNSMLTRNIGKTCGDPVCVSAYGRSLWGLSPRSPEVVVLPRSKRKARATNFTAAQRVAWIDVQCAWCGRKDNLTLDHIIPVCAGGLSVRDNAQTLCGPHNNWKAKYIDRPLARQQTRSGGCLS